MPFSFNVAILLSARIAQSQISPGMLQRATSASSSQFQRTSRVDQSRGPRGNVVLFPKLDWLLDQEQLAVGAGRHDAGDN